MNRTSASAFLRAHYVEPSDVETLTEARAYLRGEAIAVGRQLEAAKIEGKTMLVIRGLETAHQAAWQRFYSVDGRLRALTAETVR